MTKSQVDALMNQLARAWESEFETLCTLLANAAVVHADETSWSIKSVWAFLSEHARAGLKPLRDSEPEPLPEIQRFSGAKSTHLVVGRREANMLEGVLA